MLGDLIMVDFNNEATVGTPRSDILAVLILQRRNDAINSIEHFNKLVGQGADPPIAHLRSSILAFFMEFRAALKNSLSDKEYASLLTLCQSNDADHLSEAFMEIDDQLYKKNIIKIDSRKSVDTDDIEASNAKDNI